MSFKTNESMVEKYVFLPAPIRIFYPMKKNIYFFFFLTFLLMSCEHDIMDKVFNEDYYKSDFQQLYQQLSPKELFLINYAIIRQRDYFGYQVKGKTYKEILEMAERLAKTKIQTPQIYDEAPPQNSLTTRIGNIEFAYLPKKGSKTKKVKHIKFSCEYQNKTDKPVALNYSTFIINGPFGQHLMTAGYETNCKILPHGRLKLHYVVNAKHLKANLFFGKKNKITRTMINDIIRYLDIQVGGVTVDKNTKYYDECFTNGSVVEPFKWTKYREMYPDKKIKLEKINGVTIINRGTKLYIQDDEDKVLNYH